MATITGSITKFGSACSRRAAATARARAAVASIPVLQAAGGRSDATARIWARTVSAGTGWTPLTPRVFCTVTAVSAEAP